MSQLIMRNPDITGVSLPALPEGFSIVTHKGGDEKRWEEIIESAFGMHFDFDFLINAGDYSPEKVLYLEENGIKIATTSAVENPKYKGEGWFRMVGVHGSARGKGAGRIIAIAALEALKNRGYKSAVLSTDDARIPAINLYLSIGFEPVYAEEDHKERWQAVFEEIKKARK